MLIRIKNMEKEIKVVNSPFKKLGFLLPLIGLIVSSFYIAYTELWKKPELTWSVKSNEQIFTLNDELDSLSIIYNGENLLNRKDELKFLTLSIKNTGALNITENMYSEAHQYGFTIENAEIISAPEIIFTNKKYIQTEIGFVDSIQKVRLPKSMLDKGDEFLIKVLYFSKSDSLIIKPDGKISGVTFEHIPIVTREIEEDKKEIPTIIYILGLLFFIYIAQLLYSIPERLRKRRRKKRFSTFEKNHSNTVLPPRIKSLYLEHGKNRILGMLDLLTKDDELKDAFEKQNQLMKSLMTLKQYDEELDKDYNREFCHGYHRHDITLLLHHDGNHIFETIIDERGQRYNKEKLKTGLKESAEKLLQFLQYE